MRAIEGFNAPPTADHGSSSRGRAPTPPTAIAALNRLSQTELPQAYAQHAPGDKAPSVPSNHPAGQTGVETMRVTRAATTAVLLATTAVGTTAIAAPAFAQGPQLAPPLFKDLKWRSIGPTIFGGRILDIEVARIARPAGSDLSHRGERRRLQERERRRCRGRRSSMA